MSKEYFIISDLHLSQTKKATFEKELISFLKNIENKENSELIIAGDLVDLWDINNDKILEKLNKIINQNKTIFEQFKKTGNKIPITLISGNHDHELVCIKETSKILNNYKIHLSYNQEIIRKIKNKNIWIEHGHKYDKANRIEDFKNPKSKPLAYYVDKEVLSRLKNKDSNQGFGWVDDIYAVQPRDFMFNWLFSKYFYKELNPFLKYSLLPFLILFMFSFLVLIAGFLKRLNLIDISFLTTKFGEHLGIFGNILDVIIFFDGLLIIILILLALPIYFIYKDLKKKSRKYGLDLDHLNAVNEKKYVDAAKKVFKKHKNVAIFVFGHNHQSVLKKINNKVIMNAGTWMKILTRITPLKIFILPSVYYPNYQLTYGHIYSEKNKIISEVIVLPKKIKPDLSHLEKLAIFLKHRKKIKSQRTFIEI